MQLVLSLGMVPLANAFLSSPDELEERFPLELVFCPECSLVQITETVSPGVLFSQYNYFSSVSKTMLAHAQDLVGKLIEGQHLNKESHVIELGSNDGYLLRHFQQAGIPNVLGIDPAQNVAEVARASGIPTLCEFFGEALTEKIEPADVVIALNVLGHVPDLTGFVRGICKILKPDGVAIIEVPYARDMVDLCELDTIYHEHHSYFSLTSLVNLFRWNKLQVQRVERIDIHGGSLRLWVGHPRENYSRPTLKILKREMVLGIDRIEYYRHFASRVQELGYSLKHLLRGFKAQGKQIIAYGAAAKGTMLLNYLGVGTETIDYVVDATPSKIGKYVPGVRVPIVSPDQIGNPDFILLTAWNFSDEIIQKHPGFKGRWIIPIPRPRFG